MTPKISVSILSADLSNLKSLVKKIKEAGADSLHFDVMDGHFVEPLTFGSKIAKAVTSSINLPLDVHLMTENPEKYFKEFADLGTAMISFHFEATSRPFLVIKEAEKYHLRVGLAIKPTTPPSALDDFLKNLDLVLIMTVEPGYGGQPFNMKMIDKIREVKKKIKKRGLKTAISFDGGINKKNASRIVKAGADILCVGSAIFENGKFNLEKFKELRRALR